jgi:hypothetical protein
MDMDTVVGVIEKIHQTNLEYYLMTVNGAEYKVRDHFPIGSNIQFKTTNEPVTIEVMGKTVTNKEAWFVEIIS